MLKAYIVTFNQPGLLEPFNYQTFHQFLLGYPDLSDWWHYLKCTYIVLLPIGSNASQLTQYLLPYFKKINFFVIEVNLQNHNGLLHPDAWKWINDKIRQGVSYNYDDIL